MVDVTVVVRLNPERILLEAGSLTILPPFGPCRSSAAAWRGRGCRCTVCGCTARPPATYWTEGGLGYHKDLDLVFRVDLRSGRPFQLTKEVVLACLLDFLPAGVSRAKCR